MLKRFSQLLCVFFVGLTSGVWGQVEDEDCLPPTKKVQKLIDKARTSSPQDAALLFQEAMDKEEQNATVYYEFAMYMFENAQELYRRNPDPRVGDKSMKTAARLFEKTIERCDYFHSDCFYYLGLIAYNFGDNDESEKWLKKFVAYDNKDKERYAEDHQKRIADVQKVLEKFENTIDFTADPVPFDPSIVRNVSSANNEYFPMISPDNELIFFTRKLDRRAKGDMVGRIVEEFTWAKRENMKALFDAGQPVAPPFNDGSFDSYGSATLSVDNKEMIICACRDEMVQGQQYRNCDLYVTYYELDPSQSNQYIWSPLKNLGPGINTKNGWEAQPTLSADGNTLYFTALRPNTKNDDIYFSQRQPDNSWGEAQPFIEINSPGKDKSPFFHQDSETFYFVSSTSESRQGLGGTDIYYIRKKPDGGWSEPKNIGYPINSVEDEIGLFVSTDGREAYFSSRQGGNWNIYSFELYEEARPQEVVILKGEMKDEKGNPVKDASIEIAYEGEDNVQEFRVNGDDGKFAAVVKKDKQKDVMVSVKKEGHAFDSQLITKEDIAKVDKLPIKTRELEVRKLETGKPYTINDILYATASAELTKQSKFILQQFSRFLKENPNAVILIQGHTDNEGNADKNMTLSQNRAEGVKNYLISLGIDAKRLKSKGYGQTQPKVPNNSSANKAKNRRTDFVIESL
jgi:outer membrane protein OmpA-like peptidoglycan-associated protein